MFFHESKQTIITFDTKCKLILIGKKKSELIKDIVTNLNFWMP